MADLRDLAATMGFDDPITYIQSGNLVVGGDLDERAIVGALEPALEARFGFSIPVVVRSAAELAVIAEDHPFGGADPDPRRLMVAFLDRPPSVDIGDVLDPSAFAPDRFRLLGREVYLQYPNGSGRSKLSHSLLEQRLGVRATIRNWNTVARLVELGKR